MKKKEITCGIGNKWDKNFLVFAVGVKILGKNINHKEAY
jgi:hypothetical protein